MVMSPCQQSLHFARSVSPHSAMTLHRRKVKKITDGGEGRGERENPKEVRNQKKKKKKNHRTFQFMHSYLIYKAWLFFFFFDKAQMATTMSTSTHVQGKRHRQLLAVNHKDGIEENFIEKGSLPTLKAEVSISEAQRNQSLRKDKMLNQIPCRTKFLRVLIFAIFPAIRKN